MTAVMASPRPTRYAPRSLAKPCAPAQPNEGASTPRRSSLQLVGPSKPLHPVEISAALVAGDGVVHRSGVDRAWAVYRPATLTLSLRP
jgi:hypothetical protein